MTEYQPLWGPDRPDDPPPARPEPDGDARPDPRLRPPDPAGTQPKFDPDELRPTNREPLVRDSATRTPRADVEGEAFEEFGDHAEKGDLLPQPVPAAAVGRAGGQRGGHAEAPFAPRFQFITGALVALAVAAIALVVLVAVGSGGGGSEDGKSAWSSWRPTKGSNAGATQIAEHVAHQYRLDNGKQLVLATGGPMEVADLPLSVVLRNTQGDIQEVGGKGVLYRLCGLGPQCSIDSGKATVERHLLLRREALELALYTFRYLSDVDYAVVFLPPATGPNPSQALLIRKSDVRGALAQPLNATLFKRTPNTKTVASSPDAPFVQSMTMRQLFSVKGFTQGNQDARAYLVLEPLSTP